MSCLIDSSVLIDVFSGDRRWGAWSRGRVAELARAGSLAINDIVYAEVSIGFPDQAGLDQELEALAIAVLPLTRASLFRAGQAFLAYRRGKGPRETILPDFLIGAHAADLGVPLLTRDPRRVRASFPDLDVIAP